MADVQPGPPDLVELRVRQRPARLDGTPVFADPVVLEGGRVEVGPEAAPTSRGDTVMAEDRQRKQHEMAADAYQTFFGRSAGLERTIVQH